MAKTNAGQDIQARLMGGGILGVSGVGSGTITSTTYTATGTAGTADQFVGQIIVAGSTSVGAVYGVITTNTAATPTVVTVDRWYNPATPGGAAATTPIAGPYAILPGGAPAYYMGLSASALVGATAVQLSGEITTASGGLIRKICPFAHTAGANTYTLTPVFTANGSDSLPVTVLKIGVFTTLTVASSTSSSILFETALTPTTATLSTSGDQLTVTETVTM